MPKITENLPTRLVAEAKRQVEEEGYSAMTIRSVTAACGVGVGTVYNYFDAKEKEKKQAGRGPRGIPVSHAGQGIPEVQSAGADRYGQLRRFIAIRNPLAERVVQKSLWR